MSITGGCFLNTQNQCDKITNDDLPEDICKEFLRADNFLGCQIDNTFNLGLLNLTDRTLQTDDTLILQEINNVQIPTELELTNLSSIPGSNYINSDADETILGKGINQGGLANSIISLKAQSSCCLSMVADCSADENNLNPPIFGGLENQCGIIMSNRNNTRGCQILNRTRGALSGNLNAMKFSLCHSTGDNPVQYFEFRIADTNDGAFIGQNGTGYVNNSETGSSLLTIDITNSTFNNNLVLTTGQISTAPTAVDDIANKLYVDSRPIGNPFDQDLNTFDSPTFNVVDASIFQGNKLAIVEITSGTPPDGVLSTNGFTFSNLAGGTQDLINHYEDSYSATINISGTSWSQNPQLRCARIGNICFLSLSEGADTGGGILVSADGIIPVRFRPSNNFSAKITAWDGADANEFCEVIITSSGQIKIGESDNNSFSISLRSFDNLCGWRRFHISYML